MAASGLKIEIFILDFNDSDPDTVTTLMANPVYSSIQGADSSPATFGTTEINGKIVTVTPEVAVTGRCALWIYGT